MMRDRDMTPPDEYRISQSSDDRLSEIEQEMFADRVQEEIEAIIREEGFVTIRGIYFANPGDASRQRMWYAEERVRAKARAREIELRSEVRRAS